MRRVAVFIVLVVLATATRTEAQQGSTAPSLKVQLDGGPRDATFSFESMAPGWHITSGKAAVLHDPRYFAEHNWALEAEIFLFPGQSNEGYGIFFGGKGTGDAIGSYIAFLLRRDGSAALLKHDGSTIRALRPWTAYPAIGAASATDPVKQIVRAEVSGRNLRLLVNGTELLTMPTAELELSGRFGFRVGSGLNLHASRLDMMQRLAPVKSN